MERPKRLIEGVILYTASMYITEGIPYILWIINKLGTSFAQIFITLNIIYSGRETVLLNSGGFGIKKEVVRG